MKMTKWLSFILAIAMLASLLTACSSGDDGPVSSGGGSSAGEVSNPGAGQENVGGVSVDEAGASVQKDVINIGIEADVTDWAPWGSGDVGRNAALWGIYQPLLDFNNGEYIPVLLKSYEFSEDGLEFYGVLWDNIHDSDGNPFTAEDVAFNVEYAGEIYTDFKVMIKEVIPTGDTTFTIELYQPLQVAELKALCTWNFVTEEAYHASGDQMHSWPVGTGPYVLSEHTSGYMFTFKKNENFWMTGDQIAQARDMANADTINWYIISESAQRTVALEQGTIDMCGSISSQDLAKFDNKNGYQLFSYPNNLSMVLFPNCDASSPCSDVNLRRAICYAINNEAVLTSVYGGNGTVMFSQVPGWADGVNPEWAGTESYYNYNPETAASYLAQSSYNKETLRILCASDEKSTNTAQLVQAFLGQIGINAEVNPYESSTFTSYLALADKWDIVVMTRPCGTGFYAPTLFSDFSYERFPWGGTINFAMDDDLQDMIDTCMTVETSTQENIDALEQYIRDNCYVMGLVNIQSYVVVPDTVSDICLSVRKTLMPGGCVYTE